MKSGKPLSPPDARHRGPVLGVIVSLAATLMHAGATVAELEALQRTNANLLFQYAFEGEDDADRLLDGSGLGHVLQRVAGTDGGSTDDIVFVPGFDGGQAFRPAFNTTNRRIGAALRTVSTGVPIGASVTVEMVVKMDDFVMPGGGSGGYLLSARPNGKQRGYFFRQTDVAPDGSSPSADRVTSTFGSDFTDAPAVLSYQAGDWYYLALTAGYNTGTNITTVRWYAANLSDSESSLTLLASDDTTFAGDWTGNTQVGVGCFLNGTQEYLEGEIDSVALTNEVLTQSVLQARLDTLLGGLPDDDGDGMPNDFELAHTDPPSATALDPAEDPDKDGLGNLQEYENNGDPNEPDTDGDSFWDGFEVAAGTAPNNAGSVPPQAPGFVLVENFEGPGMTEGQSFHGVSGWNSSLPSATLVAADPVRPANKVGTMTRPDTSTSVNLHKPLGAQGLALLEGNTGTLFLQVYADSTEVNHNYGLSDVAAPSDFPDYEAQTGLVNAGVIGVRPPSGFLDTGYDYAAGVWMNVWIVADNQNDVIKVHYESPAGGSGRIDVTPDTSPNSPFDFRNGTASALSTLFLRNGNAEAGGTIRIDNIHVDPVSENLSLPPMVVLPPVTADDTIEVGVGGALAFAPLENDGGGDPSSLEIVTAPSHGSIDVKPGGTMVYKHTGTTPGTDLVRYRVWNTAGTAAAEADVSVSISGALRLENHTLNVPPQPPSAPPGELVIEDALPGLTFPHAAAMDGVPGNPNALLIATVKSQIWLIPDTTAATPVKHLLLDLSGLTNLTNGRSIYSIECFPDFATTGHIVVNYQGDKTRLPVPNNTIPNLNRNGTSYTTITCDLRVSRFTLSPSHIAAALDGLSTAENNSALATEWPYLNLAEQGTYHTIGDVKFGADGYLYISFGDEGEQEANFRNTQTITKDQFSSIIRIDVDPASTNPKPNPHYSIAVGALNGPKLPNTPFTDAATQQPNFRIPADNPFVIPAKGGTWDGFFNATDHSGVLGAVRDEIWALGFRYPFKFHIDTDAGTGEVVAWVGDVGRHDWEEFNVVTKGFNGGWAYYEGASFNPPINYTPSQPAGGTPHSPPLHAYDHTNSNGCAIGGILYHGTALPELTGRFVGADFNSGRVFSISQDGSSVIELTNLRLPSERIVDFELDPATGDIFVLENNTWSGGAEPRLFRITEQGGGGPEDYPQTLSELGIFADLTDLSPNTGVLPYSPNLKFWSDGADKSRWFAMPNLTDTIGYSAEGNWSFPEGMLWVKHFDFDLDRANPGTSVKRLETRVLMKTAAGSYGVAYRWNESGTEATLVPNEGEDFTIDYLDASGNPASQVWHIPTRSECMTCHTAVGGHALSMNTRQFNLDNTIHGQSGNLIQLLSDSGHLAGFNDDPVSLPRHYRPDETDVDLEARVRSYLAVNCSYCHQQGGNAPPSWDGRAHLPMDQTHILYGQPLSEGTPDPANNRVVIPGDKDHSIIWNRVNARSAINGTYNGNTQMPPLATNVFDTEGIALLEYWIDNHANLAPAPADGSLGGSTVSENALVGHILGLADAEDPDVRGGTADQARLTYSITAGNESGLFSIDPATGEIRLNGWIDYERQPQHVLTVEVSDRFAPNPGVLTRTVIIDLVDETSPDLTDDLDDNGIFDAWESGFGLGTADPSGDPDHDGIPTFFEFLAGGNPNVADPPSLLGVASEPAPSGGLFMEWNARNGFLPGGDYGIQKSGDMDAWDDLSEGVGYEVISVTPVSPGVSRVRIRVPDAPAPSFLRLLSP